MSDDFLGHDELAAVVEPTVKVHMGATIPVQQYGQWVINVSIQGDDPTLLIAQAQAAIAATVGASVEQRVASRREIAPDSDHVKSLVADPMYIWLAAAAPQAAEEIWRAVAYPDAAAEPAETGSDWDIISNPRQS